MLAASPEIEKLVFVQSVEALFQRALGPHLSREGRRQLRALGLELTGPLKPSYALAQWKSFLRVAAFDVFPAACPRDAYFSLGERYFQGYLQTTLGRASLMLVTRMGPQHTVGCLPHSVRAGNNFNEVRVEELGTHNATLWMKDVTADNPFFACGFLSEMLRTAGAASIFVVPVAYDGTSATFRLSWTHTTLGPLTG